MTNMQPSQGDNPRTFYRGLAQSMLLNIAVPFLLYYLLKNYLHQSDIIALSIACFFPVIDNIISLIRHRRLDLFGALFLVGAIVSTVLTFIGGDVRLLLIRESLITGVYGLLCFLSLFLLPRPMMFYVGRQMVAGNDPVRLAGYEASWQHSYGRFVHRLITTVWGCTLTGEFLLRVLIAFLLPPAAVLVIGPILLTVAIASTFFWTFSYMRRVRPRMQALRQNQAASAQSGL
ncbi:hypothetical protein EPA93_13040 [Ktedonosporobacter rubrisoli]|uniref:DUF3159 domain-containing protein n=1 Tax=Ktedonosporobacter rubrisoli TaxID=2509675 RepID=A0A4P6JP27_KTERU|nr:VC0807 family protein [Ktedonosporobacter rubrisoli]QBD76880.1 hypothetical protein EPA93_13040 [Ktedonosporobacter rubrisoli]